MLRNQIREAREQGFTLIELLIVIVVLGILAGIVVFGVGTFRGDAQSAACKADLKTVQVAYDAYVAAKGVVPPGATAADKVTTLVTAKYIKSTPATTFGLDATTGEFTATC